MRSEERHPLEQDLLLYADGELSARHAAQVRAHLAACWDCRARMEEIEAAITNFARAYRETPEAGLPPIAGPRALLKAQMAELAAQPELRSRQHFFPFASATRAAMYVCAALLIAAATGFFFVRPSARLDAASAIASIEQGAVPNPSLTPGAIRRVSMQDVCAMAHEDVVRDVPTPLRQRTFEEYGIVNAQAGDYEIDYLIAPGLGGTQDIHNLWPEPYTSRTWNARVKDTLEEHLHEMVCSGKLDLSTAQRDISTDWIGAYKKYFNTDRPLPAGSDPARRISSKRQGGLVTPSEVPFLSPT